MEAPAAWSLMTPPDTRPEKRNGRESLRHPFLTACPLNDPDDAACAALMFVKPNNEDAAMTTAEATKRRII
jgi:hypothetical protein